MKRTIKRCLCVFTSSWWRSKKRQKADSSPQCSCVQCRSLCAQGLQRCILCPTYSLAEIFAIQFVRVPSFCTNVAVLHFLPVSTFFNDGSSSLQSIVNAIYFVYVINSALAIHSVSKTNVTVIVSFKWVSYWNWSYTVKLFISLKNITFSSLLIKCIIHYYVVLNN